MSILIAYMIIGLTFVVGLWQGYKDNIIDYNAADYAALSLSICVVWPICAHEMTKNNFKF